ncbi:hypothetical protein GCM10025866_06360 [Naasia aerilata]|uniref:ABC transporter domain-containing protein n=1 Tax=Naasia aerilata TaxID=1162966 RepID=A0ABN6XIL7_9MICO|nr:hypothetical protein GCM10025866_06360 [Naasia aerilata]
MKLAELTQQLDELDEVADDRVSDVVGRLRTGYVTGSGSSAVELTPGQLLERLGFTSAQLSTAVRDLSGGQKRRLQLLLILLEEPNVLILDEPTNDLDTDMLAAMEDLLDTWPGTLLVVSHDRYLLERVTDQQYAVLEGRMRHLPRGVDEYLELRRAQDRAAVSRASSAAASTSAATAAAASSAGELSGSERRAAEKELSSIDRRLERITTERDELHTEFALHDQADYAGLLRLQERMQELDERESELETRWLELGEQLG